MAVAADDIMPLADAMDRGSFFRWHFYHESSSRWRAYMRHATLRRSCTTRLHTGSGKRSPRSGGGHMRVRNTEDGLGTLNTELMNGSRVKPMVH